MFQFRRKNAAKLWAAGLLVSDRLITLIVVFMALIGYCATLAGVMFFFADKDLPLLARTAFFGLLPLLVGGGFGFIN